MGGSKRPQNFLNVEPEHQNKISKTDSYTTRMMETHPHLAQQNVLGSTWKLKSKMFDFIQVYKYKELELRQMMSEVKLKLENLSTEESVASLESLDDLLFGELSTNTFIVYKNFSEWFHPGVNRIFDDMMFNNRRSCRHQEILNKRRGLISISDGNEVYASIDEMSYSTMYRDYGESIIDLYEMLEDLINFRKSGVKLEEDFISFFDAFLASYKAKLIEKNCTSK